jgi:serine O-acetyltransferase
LEALDVNAPFPRPAGRESYPNLEGTLSELRAVRARSHQARYGNKPPPRLPSRKTVIEIVEGLVAALFPRHFGPPGLAHDDLDTFVEDKIVESLRLLEGQIRLELELTASRTEARPGEAAGDWDARAFEMTTAFAAGLGATRTMLEVDIRAAYEGDPAATSIDEVMSCYPGVMAIIRHRFAHALHRLGAPILARNISEFSHANSGIDIHPGAEIGEGVFIDHGTGLVIGGTAIVGRRVRLYQAVTLGARRFRIDEHGALEKNYPRHPIVEDDVVIYAGATILGRITIGRGSVIAGNVWLTNSVPPGSVITQARARNEAFQDGGGI